MSRNCLRGRASLLAACCSVFLGGAAGGQEAVFPYMGTLTGDRVNVRAGSSINYEALCKLNEGDRVAVREERGGWLKVVPPPPVRVWIWGEFVRDGVVVKDAVNVRARPDNRSSIMCQVDKGDAVRIVDRQGEWLGISPPYDCYVWVSKKFVEYSAPMEPTKEDLSEKLFEKCEGRRKIFDRRADGARKELEDLLACYGEVIAGAPESKVARRAQGRVDELEKTRKEMDRALERKMAAEEKKEERPAAPAPPKRPPQRCIATGILKRAEEPVGGAEHRLTGKRFFIEKNLCYCRAPGMDLGFYVGKKVTITGVLAGRGAGAVPVVEVQSIVLE